ncbi:MAG TPA: DUF1365 domain-containing protein [Gaiellales bacterium]|nr:DUF1365 domain-containing protein [Gaiellales bacterium]
MIRSCLYLGQVVHDRRGDVANRFRYRVYMWLVDLDELPRLDRALRLFGNDRPALTSIRSRDHLGDPSRTIKANVLAYLRANGIELRGGRVLLLTNARVLGYVFNPLSVFYCHDEEGTLRCVVAEVHNTYGERHCYLLEPGERGRTSAGKDFYVSPFLTVDGHYRLAVPAPDERLSVQMQLVQGGHTVFRASLTGRRLELTPAAVRRTLLRHPLMTARVTALIHLQGMKLWVRGLRSLPRPRHAPQDGVGHPR